MKKLSEYLELFQKKNRSKKSVLEKSCLLSSFEIKSDFENLYIVPVKYYSPSIDPVLESLFSKPPEGYCISWKDFHDNFLDSSDDLPEQTKSCFGIEAASLNSDGEGVSGLLDNHETSFELINALPNISNNSNFIIELSILGFSEIEFQIFYLNPTKINITERVLTNGLIINLGSLKKPKYSLIPYWAYQLIQHYHKNKDFWTYNNKPLIAILQSIQDWQIDNQSSNKLVLKDLRLADKKVIYISSFDLYANKSLESSSLASLIPSSMELDELLSYQNEEEKLFAIQRAIRNWDSESKIISINKEDSSQVLLALSEKTLKAFKLIKNNFFNKKENLIIDALRYHSSESIIRQFPDFDTIFNLDINNYGQRVIGLGEPIAIPGQFGKSMYKSLIGDIDELYSQDERTGNKLIALKFPCIDGSVKKIFLEEGDLVDIKKNIKHHHENNILLELQDRKTYKNLKLDLSSKESFNLLTKQINSSLKNITKTKDPVKALQINTSYEALEYDEISNIKNSQESYTLDSSAVGLKPGIKLFDYQIQGIEWIANCFLKEYPGVLFADDMGLGKTLQTMVFIKLLKQELWEKRFGEELIEPILIIVPPILLHNFEEQANIFFENPDEFKVLHGDALAEYQSGIKSKGREIKAGYSFLDFTSLSAKQCIVTTYDTVSKYELSFAKIAWGLMLCDEVQKAKAVSSGISRVLKAIATKTSFKILMSGTPIENSMYEFWNILDTSSPGLLGALVEFKQSYPSFFKESSDTEKEGDFNKLIHNIGFGDFKEGFVNGRLKEKVKDDLPKKIETDILCDLDEETNDLIREVKASSIKGLEKVQQIKQLCIHRFLRDSTSEEDYSIWIDSNDRLEKFKELINKISQKNEKVLVFCEFHSYQNIVQQYINNSFGLKLKPINSLVNNETRRTIINDFQHSDGFSALVLSPKCAGMGLNLQAANHVIHLTRWWNPAVEDQATCRAYRTGQNKDVYVYYFVATNYFEQTLNERLAEKRKMRKNLFDLSYTKNVLDEKVLDGIK